MGAATRLVVFVTAVAGCGRVGFDAGTGDAATPPAVVGFQFATSLTDESVGVHAVSIGLTMPATDTVTVDVEVIGGTASDGGDFTLGSNRVTLLAGESQADLILAITDDGAEEPDETIELRLTNPTNAELRAADHEVTISSNILPRVQFQTAMSAAPESGGDQAFVIALDIVSPVDVIVGVGVAGTASPADHDLETTMVTIPAGGLSKQLNAAIINDLLDEFDETINLTLTAQVGAVIGANPSHLHTIADEDPPPTVGFETSASATPEALGDSGVRVNLDAPSGKTVTVDYTAIAGSAGAGDYTLTAGPLVFPPGVTVIAVPIMPVDDTLDEDDETVGLQLANANNATIRAVAGMHSWTISDDDLPPALRFANASGTVPESAGMYTATVQLAAPSGRMVQFSLVVGAGSANAMDFMVSTGPYTLSPGQISTNVSVTIANDSLDEMDEMFTLTLAAPVNASIGTPATHTVTITDDDVTASFNPGQVSLLTPEGDGAGTTDFPYQVILSMPSTITVQVGFTVTGTANATDRVIVSPNPIAFPPGQTVNDLVVRVNHDNLNELDETVVLTLTSGVNAEIGPPATRTHTIANDD